MTPPCHSFPVSDLASKVQQDVRGRRRKLDQGTRRLDLSACELSSMLQYKCKIENPQIPDSPVHCFAIERLFRRCKDRNGTFTAETTNWEKKDRDGSASAPKNENNPSKPFQWSSNWQDADTPS